MKALAQPGVGGVIKETHRSGAAALSAPSAPKAVSNFLVAARSLALPYERKPIGNLAAQRSGAFSVS